MGKYPESDINFKRDRIKILEYLERTDISLETEYPKIAKEFNQEKNSNLKTSFFHPGSNERVWWKCSTYGYE
ncbi:MAG: zinc-ribbon domain-containing protein [Lachnospiraceae bacterium]|nr:zinc-ribbon domain-containing protein [Lachnospiraceae bacterium]